MLEEVAGRLSSLELGQSEEQGAAEVFIVVLHAVVGLLARLHHLLPEQLAVISPERFEGFHLLRQLEEFWFTVRR